MQYHHHNGRAPCHPAGESRTSYLRVDFDRRLKLEFHGSKVTSDAGLLAYRELDDALGLTEVAEGLFQDSRTGKNGRHGMVGQFRQSLFGRLGGYDDVNDADRLGRDPAMRWIVGGKAVERQAASASQMGRFETELLVSDENFAALTDLSGVWIDRVHARYVLAFNEPLKSLFSQHPAKLLLALAGRASLPHLRGVDAVEPDLGVADLEGVAVDDAGFAGDVGVGRGWEQEKDYGKGKAKHRRMITDYFFGNETTLPLSRNAERPSSFIVLRTSSSAAWSVSNKSSQTVEVPSSSTTSNDHCGSCSSR